MNPACLHYKSYRFMRDEEGRNPNDVYLANFTPEEGASKFIVHSAKEYRVYNSHDAFYDDLQRMHVVDRSYHETSLGGRQKLKVDVDCDDPNVDRETYQLWLAEIIEGFTEALYLCWNNITITTDDLCICQTETLDEHGQPKLGKFSNHIILPGYCVSSNQQAKKFAVELVNILGQAGQIIDLQPYSKTQDFRIVGCHKEGQPNRIKRVVSNHTWYDSLITVTNDCTLLADLVIPEPTKKRAMRTYVDDIVLDHIAAHQLLDDHEFKSAYQNDNITRLLFKRLRPSKCTLCDVVHDKDNTLIVFCVQEGATLRIFEDCRRQEDYRRGEPVKPGRRTSPPKLLATIGVDNITPGKIPSGSADAAIIRAIKRAANTKEVPWVPPYVQAVIYDEPELRTFPLCRTLYVKANMKMGKTKKLTEYLADHFTDTEISRKVIRFVSFRQTFSGNIKEKFPEFSLYSEESGRLSQLRLIVQVESLHRLEIRVGQEPPDLLILDECESIFEQFDSGLIKHFGSSFAKFEYLVRCSKHVVCMDAHLGARTMNIMARLRNPEGSILHHAVYKNATDDTYWLTSDKARWLALLYEALDSDEKVAIPSSSLTDAKVIKACIQSKYPTLKVCLYSRETLNSTKVTHFAKVDHYWSQYDVLIYTPTITAGVSFEKTHFTKIFGYFTNLSCSVETCIQMIGRIRDVEAHSYFICMNITPCKHPTEPADIIKRLYDQRRCLVEEQQEDANCGIVCKYDEFGNPTLHQTEYFYVWLENRIVRNVSLVRFSRQFVNLVTRTGATCKHLSPEEFAAQTMMTAVGPVELAKINADLGAQRDALKAQTVDSIFSAPCLTVEQATDITQKMLMMADVTPEEQVALEKYKLAKCYGVPGETLSKDFIMRYDKPILRTAYKNKMQLLTAAKDTPSEQKPKWSAGSLDVALARIKVDEAAYHTLCMMSPDLHHLDIKKKYTLEKHQAVCGLLTTLGFFDGPFDKSYVAEEHIESTMLTTEYYLAVKRTLEVIESNTIICAHSKEHLAPIMKVTQSTMDFYGVRLKKTRNKKRYELVSLLPPV